MSSQPELAPLSIPSASRQQAGLAEWLLGGLSIHLAEELAWETGRVCMRYNLR